MASWTDQLINFNPYIPQIPTDDYVRVGLEKQLGYRQGVEKVQGYIDSVAGLDVIKPEQKDYLNQRIGNLQGEVSKIVSRDFSNQQLQNSVGNLTSKIASDPIIQSSVISTHRYREGIAKMKQAQTEGKSSPSNEWFFQDKVTKWLGDKDITKTLDADYIPYNDVSKKVLGIIKELHPDSQLEDIPYSRGANGQILLDKQGMPSIDYAMMQKSIKGLNPEKIKAAIQAELTPEDTRQLQIDGAYTYRGHDKEAMKLVTDQSYTYRLEQVNDAIKGLALQRQTAKQTEIPSIDAKINALKDRASSYQDEYKKDIQSIDTNLEGYKSSLYTQNWLYRFGEGFAYAENALTYKDNPFFQAAEKKRENDIKYQEFLTNKWFEGQRLNIEKEKLQIEKDKLDAYMLRYGLKTLKGGAPLTLTGADVREPIEQDQLDKIGEASFLNENDEMEKTIDDQKMALLSQIAPDLVHVVRDADGKNPHYEYNVEGKDENDVKTQADAAIAKLKDGYDKNPNNVDDAVRTYFDNTANQQHRLDNRKAGIISAQEDASKKYNLDPLLKTVQPLNVVDRAGNKYSFTAQEQVDFNNKMDQIKERKTGSYGVPYDSWPQSSADKVFTTPKEKYLFDLMTNSYGRTDEELGTVRKMKNVYETVNMPAHQVLDARKTYLDNSVRSIVSATEPVSFPIKSFGENDKGDVRSVVGNLVGSMAIAGKENESQLFDMSDARAMLDDEKLTTYSLVSRGGDNYAIRMTNEKISKKPVEIDITKDQTNDLFKGQMGLDEFQAIREALQLSKNTGTWSTDVQHTGRQSAFNLRNGLLTDYGIKYHIEDPLKNGSYQVKLYIHDNNGNDDKWEERTARFGQLLDEAQVTRYLSMINNDYIKNLLTPPNTGQKKQ